MKDIPQKTLVIIGNGFDLAHGLKTSYNDFFKDYIIRKLTKAKENEVNRNIEDILFRVAYHNSQRLIKNDIEELEALKLHEIISTEKRRKVFTIIPLTDLAKRLYNEFDSWVDIENAYYRELKKIVTYYYNQDTLEHLDNKKEELHLKICNLNAQMDLLSQELESYLSKNCNQGQAINTFGYDFLLNHYYNNDDHAKVLNFTKTKQEICLLDFNYTNTIEKYINRGFKNIETSHIKIHGKLNDQKNKIIFGFGDERDSEYHKIENIHLDEAFKKIKSFAYFKTNNYNQLLDFIDSGKFTVIVLGHSCGLSDRVLLSTIFEHKYCEKIRICYYEYDDGTNDYTSKTYQISRHFADKGMMRKKIIPERPKIFDKIPQKRITEPVHK